MLNLHFLFSDPFINRLNIGDEKLKLIRNGRTIVKEYLQKSLPSALKRKTNIDFPTQPRFFTQGSYSYKTLNEPCHLPPQQADIDYGCYLPTEDWVDNYKTPKLASKDFFEAVETALYPLCQKCGWRLVSSKSTCVRLIISEDIHIDIPLYAIPEKEFNTLIEARKLACDGHLMDSTSARWEKLPTEYVMLAHREKGWVKSDPRLVVDWFNERVEEYSEQYRRVVRYLNVVLTNFFC